MTIKLKIKIGLHEFEAEGPETYVNAKFDEFKALCASAPAPAQSPAQFALGAAQGKGASDSTPKPPPPPDALREIFSVNETKRTVSLRVLPELTANGKSAQVGEAMLLILYGYRKFFQVDEVGAMDMASAIRDSGLGQGARVDLANRSLTSDGLATKNGAGRGLNYRITNKGTIKAEALLNELFSKIQ